MRPVYALLGLVNKWGPARVEAACARAVEAEAFNVGLIGRMLERGTETAQPPTPPARPQNGPARFARPVEAFATDRAEVTA